MKMRALVLFVVMFATSALVGCGPSEADKAAAAAKAEAAEKEQAAKDAARAQALAALEAERLAALWTYGDVPAEKGRQLTAQIYSTNNVDTDGSGAKSVRLIFRDHASWGRSSYLVLNAGDFNCYGGCNVAVTIDDAAPKQMAGRRPVTDDAIAMFINDYRTLWRLTSGAKTMSIEFPVKAGGTRTATFDVAGLDRSKMPRWDAAAAPSR